MAGVAGALSLDVAAIRAAFPVFGRRIRGRPLVYLDTAASAQMPAAAIEAMVRHQSEGHANVHRGVHTLSYEATEAYDAVRERARRFLNAASADEVIFAHGTTSAVNLVARSWGDAHVKRGDEIVVTLLEHHSNFVPWQMLAERTGARLKVAPLLSDGSLDREAFERLLSDRTRVVAVAHVSNVLGTVLPVRWIADLAHARGAVVVVDGAQSAPHFPVDVQELGCDFFVCSGHKLYGPTGVGLLYGRLPLLQAMAPYETGGGMIERVTVERTTFAPPPGRFEAGTPPILSVVGLGAAIEWLAGLDREAIAAHEQALLARATERISEVPGVRILGTAPGKVSVLSFVMDGVHPHDIGTVLDAEGIAIRAGHHCAQPLMQQLGVPGTARASFGVYNDLDDVDALVGGLRRVREVFA
ncbi:MAG TPA: SufS family cysteine desulfurase [Gemmatimonadales bacterium]|nr:SufS family cysteine desulfurase [Gemmatimonadales bacterium]